MKEQQCTRDKDLLAVSMRPYYILRELNIAVYIPLSANDAVACDVLHTLVSRLQTSHPDALILITGEFNHASLPSTLPKLHSICTVSHKKEKESGPAVCQHKRGIQLITPPPTG